MFGIKIWPLSIGVPLATTVSNHSAYRNKHIFTSRNFSRLLENQGRKAEHVEEAGPQVARWHLARSPG
jgi:hypothetical protein